MVEGKARQLYQFAYREVGATIDAIVFGELDSTHAQWQSISKEAGKKYMYRCGPRPAIVLASTALQALHPDC